VVPGRFAFSEVGVQQGPEVVVETSDEIQLGTQKRRKVVVGTVVLHQLAGVVGNHFPVMVLLRWFAQIKVPLLGSPDDGIHRHSLIIVLQQLIPHIAVVVPPHGHILVVDQFLLSRKLPSDAALNGGVNPAGVFAALVLNGNMATLLLIGSDQLVETGAARVQVGMSFFRLQLIRQVFVEQVGDLLGGKALM